MNDCMISQRQIVLTAMKARPADPWPRGIGHVVLGVPGSPREQKAYHEPGGGFSPSAGSFGISFWITGPDGSRVATGDDIPVADITQGYVWQNAASVPALQTQTPYYQCDWSFLSDDRWRGDLKIKKKAGNQTFVLIRSVGPAGGPVESLDWDGCQLIINHRWVLNFSSTGVRVFLGDEEQTGWASLKSSVTSWESKTGWGFARIELAGHKTFSLTIRDTLPQFKSPLSYSSVNSTFELDIPDKNFAASLNAQAATLLMGFVCKQTCPGEPINYPLTWERDGAYAVLAMARCGQLSTAKDLAVYFAENDYFGGFGAESDAPGSTINTIASVALISGDTEFMKWIWPHVKRKIGLIKEMLNADKDIRKIWLGPIVPALQNTELIPIICKPAQDGLIVGTMDNHYSVLYINAINYRGLIQASRLACALGKKPEAGRFLDMASAIRRAYPSHFDKQEYQNERTFMSGLWPTWIVPADFAPFRKGLDTRWKDIHGQGSYPERPLWTYFTAAEAHQWLYLDEPEIVWETLDYFWRNQCSPGLYTYWEGNGEENTFDKWPHIRGWLKPPHVTPHYWTAAEMLLLQIDMLTYLNESGPGPVVVVGGGVPAEWLKKPITAKGIPTAAGTIDWSYHHKKLSVTFRGKKQLPIKLGVNFAKDTKISVRHRK